MDPDTVNVNTTTPDVTPSSTHKPAIDDSSSNKENISDRSGTRGERWKRRNKGGTANQVTVESFKGAHPDLKGKVFIKGPTQASRYDETYKSYLTFVGTKFGQRVKRAFVEKDKDAGLKTLNKPSAPMTTMIRQFATPGDDSQMVGREVAVMDRDSEAFYEYQLKLKQYLSDVNKYEENLETCYSILLGQCSPAVEQALEGDKSFKVIRSTSNSISLLKLIECIAYNYQPHEYGPLAGWNSIDKMSAARQQEGVHETKYLEMFKTTVEVAKASGINFAAMSKPSVEMAMKRLEAEGFISSSGKYDPVYFNLSSDERSLVDTRSEEIFLSSRMLSLACNTAHFSSKQELQNDLVKGKDNYPTTTAEVMNFLSNHSLKDRNPKGRYPREGLNKREIAFAQRGEEEKPKGAKKKAMCREYEDGTCKYKKPHVWKECPFNKYGTNKDKTVDASGELVCCNVDEFAMMMQLDGEYDMDDTVYPVEDNEDSVEGNNLKFQFNLYSHQLSSTNDNCMLSQDNDHVFAQQNTLRRLDNDEKRKVNKWWILLDSGSTVDVFCNASLLTNIHTVNEEMKVHCNAGQSVTSKKGTLEGYGLVWYYAAGIANILSLYNVTSKYHVQYDSHTTDTFMLWREDGSCREFGPGGKGLYYCDVRSNDAVALAMTGQEDNMVKTVESAKSKLTARQVRDATEIRKFQNTAGLTDRAMLRVIDLKMLSNSPYTREAAQHAMSVWGPSIPNLRGKTTRSKSDVVPLGMMNIAPIPPEIIDNHGTIVLGMDVVKINKIAFLVTISRVIKLVTACEMASTAMRPIVEEVIAVVRMYNARGFKVSAIAGDNAFTAMRNYEGFTRLNVLYNPTSADEHEPYSERLNRTLKERCRMCMSTLPFDRMPRRMLVEMVYLCVFWLNFYVPEDYISVHMSPGTIATGRQYDHNKLCGPGTSFGEFVQTHEATDNTMQPRTVSAITLRPSGNVQGSFYYYSLRTGRRLHRRKCTPNNMPDEIIDRVHAMADRQGSPSGITYVRHNNEPIKEHAIDEIAPKDSAEAIDEIATQGSLPIDDIEDDEHVSDTDDNESTGNTDVDQDNPIDYMEEDYEDPRARADQDHNDLNDNHQEATDDEQEIAQQEIVQTAGVRRDERTTGVPALVDPPYVPRRSRRLAAPTNQHYYGEDVDEHPNVINAYVASVKKFVAYTAAPHQDVQHVMMTQMGMKAGVKAFGQKGVDAVFKEIKQFYDRKVIAPIHPDNITPKVRRYALGYLMFLKQKWNGDIKGRGCADGRPQKLYMAKEDTTSPTVITESLFITCSMEAREGRDVATVDIPGAFLQTAASKDTYIKLQGSMVHTLVAIDPSWKQYILYEGKKRVPTIYGQAEKAIYGTVDASKLFFMNLSSFLTVDLGFKKNDYDQCVANKMMDEKQCTIAWHVDDLKISHVDPDVVTMIIDKLSEQYGGMMPITITRGKLHKYLGMTIDYRTSGKVKFNMYQFIDDVLQTVPDIYKKGIGMATAAPENLYEIREDDDEGLVILPSKEKEEYHTLTMKLMYLSKRARPDLQTSIAFHSTRVRRPDLDDQKKLARTIRHLEYTKHLPMILSWDNEGNIQWYVDISFAVHEDMKSRTGMLMKLGSGIVYGGSNKQKINTSSTTQAELVGVSDAMPKVLWSRYFIEAQGYTVEDVVVNQDNQSTILLANNGMNSVGKRSRHIRIKYFFVTDRIKNKDLRIQYCPTDDMIADFFTKPLQGALYVKHRNNILGIKEEDMALYLEEYAQYHRHGYDIDKIQTMA